jgi:hypothetical protein
MVMSLPLPRHCSINLIGDVVRERENGVNFAYFTDIQAEWESRTRQYLVHRGSPEYVPQWPGMTSARKTTFLTLYLNHREGSSQRVVIEDLNKHALNCCPACGEFGRPNTLDHYLPKGKYPHFCITPANLFPMCDRCQKEKGEKTGTLVEPRFFLHPYFDAFLAEQVLLIVIEPPYNAPSFRIAISGELDDEQTALVASHIRELQIEARFAHFFKDEIVRTWKQAAKMRSKKVPIELALQMFDDMYEPNTWQQLYHASVLGNADFIDYLQHGDLPEDV